MFLSLGTRDRLRRSMSTHSIRKSNVPRQPSVDPSVAKYAAAAAASHAMRSSERSSAESRRSYDQLGGPNHVAVPRRRTKSSLRTETSFSERPTTRSTVRQETPASNKPHINMESAVLSPIIEPRGLDGRDSSVPSSYRRLRKAKSMFSTRQRFPESCNGGPSFSPRSSFDPDNGSEFAFPRTLRQSTSFARGRAGQRLQHAKSQDAAIQLARDQFMEEAGKENDVRSSFSMHRQKKEHKPFRKTFRSASEGSGGGNLSRKPSIRSFHRRSRTFSSTIKNGFRRVFGRSKTVEDDPVSTEESEISAPVESPAVPARPIYVRKLTAEAESGYNSAESSPLRVTAIMSEDPAYMHGSHVVSQGSAHTVVPGQSRQAPSLVEEHGDLNRQLRIPRRDGVASYEQPNVPIFDGMINTQDLYAALVRHQLERAAENANEEILYGNVAEHRVVPERASSVYSQRSRQTVRTVRRVPSIESSVSPRSFATARGDSFSPFKHQHSAKYTQPSRYAPNKENTLPGSVVMCPVSPKSAFIVQDSDDETGSVVVARLSPKPELMSPSSSYSRTTSGNTPTQDSVKQDVGTVTIISSERTAYASPNRANGPKVDVQPSADWQNWFNSEIERIEEEYPTRGHIREDAQLQDDEDINEIIREAAVTDQQKKATASKSTSKYDDLNTQMSLNPIPQNNFSRPFSRSSSVRTIQTAQRVEPQSEIKAPENNGHVENVPTLSMPIPDLSSRDAILSPMRLRSGNMPQIPESPTPPSRSHNGSMKRAWAQEQQRRYSTRRPAVKVKPAQFRSMRTHRDSRFNNENARNREHDDMMDEYYKMQEGQGTMSSKQMVEMFLDSRRRQMGLAENSDGESTAIGEAFI